MITVGVRELKARTSEIVRLVREDQETIELTYRGETVGRIVPITPKPDPGAIAQSWAELQQIIADITSHRIDDISAEETIREIRRDL